MKPNQRSVTLSERLADSRFAERASEIIEIVEGRRNLNAGLHVDVERANNRKAPNGKDFHVRIVASTEAIARDSGIIPIDAWKKGGLKNFSRNPMILAFHDHQQPIGRSVHTEITDDELHQYWEFHGETEQSRVMQALYEKGFMKAASVGFLVHDWQFIDELNEKEYAALEKKYGTSVKDIYWIARKAELLETSAVPVPSDPNALEFSAASRNAEAIGMDMSIFNRRDSMPTPKTPAAGEREEVAAPAVVAPAAEAGNDIQKMIDAAVATIRGELAGLEARLAAVETRESSTPAATPAAGTEAGTEGRAAGEIDIEVRAGETPTQAVGRHVDELLAKKQGAPQRKTK